MHKQQEEQNVKEWKNWSGDVVFTPGQVVAPANEEEVAAIVQRAIAQKKTIRAVGSSHSCATIFETKDVLLTTTNMKGLLHLDKEKMQATFAAGTTVEEAGEILLQEGFAIENTGHIDKQALAGAISTGTHGAGKKLTNLSGLVTGVTIVAGTGETNSYNQDDHPDIMRALKVSLGALGIFTRITIRIVPAFKLYRRHFLAGTADCITNLHWLMEDNRNFCFYWYPRRDDVTIRIWNFLGEGTAGLPFGKMYKHLDGWGKDILPSPQHLRFNELEYSVPMEIAAVCFNEVRERIKQKHRSYVGWRVLFRPIAKDDVYLSNSYGRETVAITIHHNAHLPYQSYFSDIEPIFRLYGGRPHWAKKHSLTAAELSQLYPCWNDFQKVRQVLDPVGVFQNDYVKRVLIAA